MLHIPGISRFYTWVMKHLMNFNFFGENVIIDPSCDISRRSAMYIHIGNRVFMSRDIWLNIPFENPFPDKNSPVIKIGDGTAIGRRCTISGIHKIDIGKNTLFGPSVFITDHSHEFENPNRPIKEQGVTEGGTIKIEEGCWFGHNSAVVSHRGREIIIGRNTIVGANAVVTKSCPAYSVMVGNPARNVGMVSRGLLHGQATAEINADNSKTIKEE